MLRNFLQAKIAVASIVIALLTTMAQMAQMATAQLTTKSLIDYAVSDLGPRYSDVDEAVKRFKNRDVLGARQFLETAKRKHPKLPPTDLTLAKMYFITGNHPAGRVSLNKTVMEDASDPETYLLLADQMFRAGRTIEAEALYDKGIRLTELFKSNAKRKRSFVIRGRLGRSSVAERREQWKAATEDLRVLIQVDPDNANAHYRLGRALFMLDKAKEGYSEFVKAHQLDEKLLNPSVAAALLYEQKNMRKKAQRAFEHAVAEDNKDLRTLAAYAQWLVQTGDIAKAESVLATARRLDPASLDVLILSGVAASMAKKVKPAEDYFVEALRVAPTNGSVRNQLALLLIRQIDNVKKRRALEYAGINAKLNPNDAEANITLAWVFYQAGRSKEAGTALRKGLQLGNLNPDSGYLVAKMLVEQNQASAAKQILDNALNKKSSGIFVYREDAKALRETLGAP